MSTRKNFIYLGGGDQRVTPITDDSTFEFEESDFWNSNDVVYSQPDHNPIKKPTLISTSSKRVSKKPLKNHHPQKPNKSMTRTSVPVNVPDWSKIFPDEYKNGRRLEDDDHEIDHSFDDEDDESLPPHEYLARTRIASFSVQEGIGRTLKGRDLSRVRNAIWKQTGFED